MALVLETRAQLQVDRIISVEDLSKFNDTSFDKLGEILSKPPGYIMDSNPNTGEGATIPAPALTIGVKSQI